MLGHGAGPQPEAPRQGTGVGGRASSASSRAPLPLTAVGLLGAASALLAAPAALAGPRRVGVGGTGGDRWDRRAGVAAGGNP